MIRLIRCKQESVKHSSHHVQVLGLHSKYFLMEAISPLAQFIQVSKEQRMSVLGSYTLSIPKKYFCCRQGDIFNNSFVEIKFTCRKIAI